jgi:PAS domain S-box-containing protein
MNEKDKQTTIMIVDDNPINLKLLLELLREKGYRVVAFPGGVQALAAAVENPPDLILLDIRMPEMDGFEVCRRLKANAALQEIPVLFISALVEAEDKVEAFAVGGADYIAKPFQPEELHARVQIHLKNRSLQRQLLRHNMELQQLVAEQTRELVDAHQRLHLALHAAKAGTWEWDLQTQKNYWSEELWNLFRIKPNSCEPSYDTWIESIHWDDREKTAKIVREASQKGVRFSIEWRVAGCIDSECWLMSYGQPLFDAGGRIERYIGIVLDITERKQAEEETLRMHAELQQKQKTEAIGSLAGGIAHDLNNILFPVCGLSELLLEDFPANSTAYEMMQQIHRSVLRGSNLVKQILAFSRRSNPEKMPIRIQPVLKEVLNLVRSTQSRNIEMTSRISPDCGMVAADPTQMHQVMINLITNACHAVEEIGGTIHVELKKTDISSVAEKAALPFNTLPVGRYACICVTDTGIGIDKTVIDKVFTPYFTTKPQGKGTGLGLSVVLGIVKEHGGDIRVTSEIGKGTTFSVYLPLLEDLGESPPDIVVRQYPTGSERILVVDDEGPILHMEQLMLEKLGYRTTAFTSSLEALAAFKADPNGFDLVISDRGMPNMTGEQLAKELMAIRPGMPIILCTGFGNETDELHAMGMGIKGFLIKPVAKADLAATVRNVLDKDGVGQ